MSNSRTARKLINTRKELFFQNKENERCLDELNILNRELVFQYKEKEKLAAEFIIANKELLFQNSEKEKRSVELKTANRELIFQNNEKEKRAAELTFANEQLEKAENSHKEYIQSLEEIMYMTSHQLRQPIAHILGLSELLDANNNTPEELVEIKKFIKQSAECLDKFTRELTTFIYMQEIKAKAEKTGVIA